MSAAKPQDPVPEDYRVQAAREGKALYVPGRSAEEAKAILAAGRAVADAKVPPIRFTAEEVARYTRSLGDVVIRMSEAENVFALLARIIQDGDLADNFGIADMASLAAKALGDMGDKELEDLNHLTAQLRDLASENSMGIARQQIALLHVAKGKLGIADADWRSTLVQIAGVTSSTELDRAGFEAIMGFLDYAGFKPLTAQGPNFGARPGMASFAQIELIRVLWFEYTHGASDEDGLNKWLERCFKVSIVTPYVV
ncbi:MAG: DUF1018 domain-containing protein [Pseudorhodobacter sp.]|nr:DUF1018 domain-containing protein [Pseudorhodobacter sp.]